MSPEGRAADEPTIVVYDDGCRFCTAAARLGERGDRRGHLRFIGASRRAELRACAIDPGSVGPDSILVRRADGTTREESGAIAEIVSAVPLIGAPLALLLRAARPVADPVYRFVARHRR